MELEINETKKNFDLLVTEVVKLDDSITSIFPHIGKKLIEANEYLFEVNPSNLEFSSADVILDMGNIRLIKHLWGITIVMNEQVTNEIEKGLISVGKLYELLVPIFKKIPGLGTFASLCAMAFAKACFFKAKQIEFVDKGCGVYWPLSLLQIGFIAAAAPGGPAALLAAFITYAHPFGNKC